MLSWGDTNLKHLESATRNIRCTYPEIQSQIINFHREFIVEKITAVVKQNRYLSILADKTTNLLWKNKWFDELVSFLERKNDLIGLESCQKINQFLESEGLNNLDCHGQGCDGAGAVAGKDKTLQAQVLRIDQKALYTHWAGYRLNLAIVAPCKEQWVRRRMEQIKEITYFFDFSVPQNKQKKNNLVGKFELSAQIHKAKNL